MTGLRSTKYTVFDLLAWTAFCGCLSACAYLGKEIYGVPGVLLGGFFGIFVGFIAGLIPYQLETKYIKWKLEQSSIDELWEVANLGIWNFNNTLALVHLAARGQDIYKALPRILLLLKSDSELERIYGWDALKLVFEREANAVEGYNPRSSKENCLCKIKKLEDYIGQNPTILSSMSSESNEIIKEICP
jgi:hypothetical protein